MPSWAASDAQHLGGQAAVGGRGALELLGQVVGALRAEVGTEGVGQLGRDHPVGPGEARRAQLGSEPADPALEVGRGAGPLVLNGAGQHDVGVGVDRLRRVPGHGDDEVAGRERRLGHGVVGEVAQAGRTRAARGHARCVAALPPAVRRRLAGHRGQDAGRIEPGDGRDGAPGRGEALAPALEGDPPGQQARGQAHVERAEHVAPAQRGQERRLGQRVGQHAQRGGGHLARLGVGGSTGHDDDTVAPGVLGQAGRGRLRARRRPARCPRGANPTTWRRRRHRSGPWPPAARHRAGWPGWRRRSA